MWCPFFDFHYEKNIWIPVDPGDPHEICLSVRTFVLKVRKRVKNLDFDRNLAAANFLYLFPIVRNSLQNLMVFCKVLVNQ